MHIIIVAIITYCGVCMADSKNGWTIAIGATLGFLGSIYVLLACLYIFFTNDWNFAIPIRIVQ